MISGISSHEMLYTKILEWNLEANERRSGCRSDHVGGCKHLEIFNSSIRVAMKDALSMKLR